MRLKKECLAFAFAMISAHSLFACEYPQPPSFQTSLTAATSIFIFQLETAEYSRVTTKAGVSNEVVVGKIRIIDVIKGGRPTFKRIFYSTDMCGGIRLDVGHFFAMVTTQVGDTLTLAPADESILDVSADTSVIDVLRNYAKGRQLPKGFPPEDLMNYMSILPAPPLSLHLQNSVRKRT